MNQYITAVFIEEVIQRPPVVRVKFPQVRLRDINVQNVINRFIRDIVEIMMSEQDVDNPGLGQVVGIYKVALNEKSLLSVYLENYAIMRMAANGVTIAAGLTVDLGTGEVYKLKDLFLRNGMYRVRINEIIRGQIKAENVPMIEGFPEITDCQEYYLTPGALVVFFQELEFTPHYYGIPEFKVPYAAVRDLIDPYGPLGRLVKLREV